MLWRLVGVAVGLYLFVTFALDAIEPLTEGASVGEALSRAAAFWWRSVGNEPLAHVVMLGVPLLLALVGAWIARRTRPLYGWLVLLVPVIILASAAVASLLLRPAADPIPACCARPPEPEPVPEDNKPVDEEAART